MKSVLDILREIHPDYDYAKSDDFMADGLLDSMDVVRLIRLIEKNYGVKIAGSDIMPMNFASVETIKTLLKNHGVTDAL